MRQSRVGVSAREPDRLTDEPRPRAPGWLRLGLIVLIVAKLVLISHEEILPYKFDDSGFADAANEFFWKARYGPYTYVKQPVYPLFVSATTVTGIPTRLAQEAFWALACWALAMAAWRVGLGGVAALAIAALSLFHPWSIFVLNRILQDALYVPLYTLMVAGLVAGIAARSREELRHWGVLAAVAGALAANTRPESVLVYGMLALTAILALIAWARGRIERPLAAWRLGMLVLAPLVAVVGLTQAICAANYARIGAWVGYDLTLPGFTRLYDALLAIPPENPNLKTPVPRDVREKAYAASSHFAKLRPFLDGDKPAKEFMDACRRESKVDGEYGGWTIWALRDATWRMSDWGWKSAGELDAFYGQCADDLRGAMVHSELSSRAVPVPLLAPEWRLMAGAAPEAIGRCGAMLLSPSYRRDHTKGGDVARFDAVANRRVVPAEISSGAEVPQSLWFRPANVEAIDSLKTTIGFAVAVAMRVGLGLGVLGLILAFALRKRAPLPSAFWNAVILLSGAVAARFALIVLLDLGAVTAQTRYLFPAAPILIALEIAGIAGGARALAGYLRWRKQNADATLNAQGAGLVSSSASAPAS
jgi:hypothetical protein